MYRKSWILCRITLFIWKPMHFLLPIKSWKNHIETENLKLIFKIRLTCRYWIHTRSRLFLCKSGCTLCTGLLWIPVVLSLWDLLSTWFGLPQGCIGSSVSIFILIVYYLLIHSPYFTHDKLAFVDIWLTLYKFRTVICLHKFVYISIVKNNLRVESFLFFFVKSFAEAVESFLLMVDRQSLILIFFFLSSNFCIKRGSKNISLSIKTRQKTSSLYLTNIFYLYIRNY